MWNSLMSRLRLALAPESVTDEPDTSYGRQRRRPNAPFVHRGRRYDGRTHELYHDLGDSPPMHGSIDDWVPDGLRVRRIPGR